MAQDALAVGAEMTMTGMWVPITAVANPGWKDAI
jgi:hypothetical protein